LYIVFIKLAYCNYELTLLFVLPSMKYEQTKIGILV